jgi:hypothetical protein
MKQVILALVLATASAAPALAQETLPLLGGNPGQEVVIQHDYGYEMRLGAYFRASTLEGTIDHDIPVDYDDLFGSGVGFMIEASLLFDLGPGFQSGGYFSFGFDDYDGERDVDFEGNSLEADDDMRITTFIFGYKGVFAINPFWHAEFHAGLGFAMYEEVDGTLRVSPFPDESVTIFKDSSGIAWDMGGRFGFNQPRFFFEAGFGWRFLDDPQEGDIDFNGGGPIQFAFEIGGGFRF